MTEQKQEYALAASQPLELSERRNVMEVWPFIKEIATPLARSSNKSVDKMMAILLKGYELGLSFTASDELIDTVQGKTSLTPRGAMALMHNSPLVKSIKVNRLTSDKGEFVGYECTIERTNGFTFTAGFTLEQAKKAGLMKEGSAWMGYAENMCRWRAVGFAAVGAVPDITCGLIAFLKQPEQMGLAIDDGGNVIDAASVTVIDPLMAEIERLCNLYGADAVMGANNGTIPQSMDECEHVENILIGGA